MSPGLISIPGTKRSYPTSRCQRDLTALQEKIAKIMRVGTDPSGRVREVLLIIVELAIDPLEYFPAGATRSELSAGARVGVTLPRW